MASTAKRSKLSKSYNTEDVLRLVLEDDEFDELDSENEGISSSEESEIDHQLRNSSSESSDEQELHDHDVSDVDDHDDFEPPDDSSGSESSHNGSFPDNRNAGRIQRAGTNAGRGRRAGTNAGRGRRAGSNAGRGRRAGANANRGHRAGANAGRARGHGRARQPAPVVAANWNSYDDPDVNVLPPFQPTRPVGVNFDHPFLRGTMTTALEFFRLFFSMQMVNSIVDHTNTYAMQKMSAGTHQTYADSHGYWPHTTQDEIMNVIALLIYFGLVKVSSFDRYWSTKTLYHGLWARRIMSRDRFKALMAMLHVVDPTTEQPGNKLRKVESFINDFKGRCKSLYHPNQNVAVDERMVKSKHRSGIRQYIKDKPTKWGIKLWVLADSETGYTYDFNVYIGKAAGRTVSENGLGYDVVMKLVEPLLHQGYHIFFDNFYTSVALVKDLFNLGLPSTGTVSENRRGFPAALKNGKEWAKRKERGSMHWERVPPLLALQWIDNKVVSMLTTIDSANDHVQVARKTKTNNIWTEIIVRQPKAIARYNDFMIGVDRSDQLLGTNNVMRKCMRWWKTLFFHLIDIAIVNSFILFRLHAKSHPEIEEVQRPQSYSLVEYKEEIVRQICDLPEYDVPPTASGVRPANQFESLHMPMFRQDSC